MNAAEMQKTLFGMEQQFWQAIKDRNGEAASRLTDDSCMVVGPEGIQEVDRSMIAGMVASAPYQLREYRIDAAKALFHALSDDMALVSYPVHEEMTTTSGASSIDAYDTSLWVRHGGEWRCALHTETLAGMPSAGR
jgi:hypothetical protein